MDVMLFKTVRTSERKLGPFEYAQSMLKRPKGSVYVGNIIDYLLYLSTTFPRGLGVDLEGSSWKIQLSLN